MEFIKFCLDIVLHLDQHLDWIIRNYGLWTYAILFIIIFCETGFVITPFLPGDSLLFASGTFVAMGSLDFGWLTGSLSLAAIAGDSANYWIGHKAGPKVFTREDSRLLNKEHLHRTHRFFQKYGGKTIIIARFVPIIRTFAPFVAGIGEMAYGRFIVFNVVGGIAWVVLLVLVGYSFGNIRFVKDHFFLVILAIIVISVLPVVFELFRHRYEPGDPQSS